MSLLPFGSAPFSLPSQSGESGKYLTTNGTTPSWASPTASAAWGSITGTLSAQTDLETALNALLPLSGGTMTGTLVGAEGTFTAQATGDVPLNIYSYQGNGQTGNLLSIFRYSGYYQYALQITPYGSVEIDDYVYAHLIVAGANNFEIWGGIGGPSNFTYGVAFYTAYSGLLASMPSTVAGSSYSALNSGGPPNYYYGYNVGAFTIQMYNGGAVQYPFIVATDGRLVAASAVFSNKRFGLYDRPALVLTTGATEDALTVTDNSYNAIGHITYQAVFYPGQYATASAPSYAPGGIYYDTTLNKMRIGGATGWETVTSV